MQNLKTLGTLERVRESLTLANKAKAYLANEKITFQKIMVIPY